MKYLTAFIIVASWSAGAASSALARSWPETLGTTAEEAGGNTTHAAGTTIALPAAFRRNMAASLGITQDPNAKKLKKKMRTRSTHKRRSTRYRRPFIQNGTVTDCEYGALVCLRALKTGILCGRSAYYTYDSFRNACELDYTNCMEGHEKWMVVHMGPCMNRNQLPVDYQGDNTYRDKEDFLNNDYVVSELGT